MTTHTRLITKSLEPVLFIGTVALGNTGCHGPSPRPDPINYASTEAFMKSTTPLDPKTLSTELVRIGEIAIAKRDDAALERYFAEGFVFHGPSGDATLTDLKTIWEAMRNAFTGFAVTRERILVEGNFVAARTRMSGLFEHDFTHSPVGLVRPTGKPVSLVIHNFFRYDDHGRLAEEWAQFDDLGLLVQLGVELHR
jgi:predicted ester cyclase